MKSFCQGVLATMMASLGILAAWWQHEGGGSAASQLPATPQHESRTPASAPVSEAPNEALTQLQTQVAQLAQALTATQAELARVADQAASNSITTPPGTDSSSTGPQSMEQLATSAPPADDGEATGNAVSDRFAHMVSEHGHQHADSGWGQEIEQGIAARLEQMAVADQSARIIDTDCRESLCKLRLSSDSIETQALLPALLATADLRGLELQHNNVGDELITEALLQR